MFVCNESVRQGVVPRVGERILSYTKGKEGGEIAKLSNDMTFSKESRI